MILNNEFYKELVDQEKRLITLYKQGNLMIYMKYGKVREFYLEKISQIKEEINKSNKSPFLESIYNILISTLNQINYIIEEAKQGNHIDFEPLFELFFINQGSARQDNEVFYKKNL